MKVGGVVRRLLAAWPGRSRPLNAVSGYDLWASTYDQTDNLLTTIDETVFGGLIEEVPIRGRTVLDVGCGTGRHWAKILADEPAGLLGVDSSVRMLERLREKYPQANVERTESHLFPGTPDGTFDVLISTLALAHFPHADAAIAEWSRVIRTGGDVIITDLHPEVVARGACTFEHHNRTLTIRLYPRSLSSIVEATARSGLEMVKLDERIVDEGIESYFEGRGAYQLLARLKGLPLIYGMHLRKAA